MKSQYLIAASLAFLTTLSAVCEAKAPTAAVKSAAPQAGKKTSDNKTLVDAWVIEQTTAEYGFVVVRATKDALRLDCDDFNIFIEAPTFDIKVYNPRNKRFLASSVSAQLLAEDKIKFNRRFTVNKLEEKQIDEIKVIHYQTISKQLKECVFDCWVNNSEFFPPRMAQAIVAYMGCAEMPQGVGMPVRMVRISSGERPYVYMDTKTAKLKKVPKAYFDLPKGYDEARNVVELRADRSMQSKREAMEELMGKEERARARSAIKSSEPGNSSGKKSTSK